MSKKLVFFLEGSYTLIFCQFPLTCCVLQLDWCGLSLCLCQEEDALGAMEKVCRQLTYHLSPHSQWRRQGLLKRKPQAWWESRADKQRGGLRFRQWGHMLPYFPQYNNKVLFFTPQFTALFFFFCPDLSLFSGFPQLWKLILEMLLNY